jgi:hypothetical protein
MVVTRWVWAAPLHRWHRCQTCRNAMNRCVTGHAYACTTILKHSTTFSGLCCAKITGILFLEPGQKCKFCVPRTVGLFKAQGANVFFC